MKRVIVVGSGAGGATVARELSGQFQVTVLEAGKQFRPFGMGFPLMETIKKTGILFDERMISLFYPALRIQKIQDLLLVRGIGVGGSTTVSCGNALRADKSLRAIGLDLDQEFADIERKIPITTAHYSRWKRSTRDLFEACSKLGLDLEILPKMGEYQRCSGCGRCVFGCPKEVKWTSRRFLREAQELGVELVTGCQVEKVRVDGDRISGVEARIGMIKRFYPADAVILAAGGLGTPVILQNSGIPCEHSLFVDPVLCVMGYLPDNRSYRELQMPFAVRRQKYFLAPYLDYLSFFFNRNCRSPLKDTIGLMIKLADEPNGIVSRNGVIKYLSDDDKKTLSDGVALASEILVRCGIDPKGLVVGTVNAGHPGGTLPLGTTDVKSMHSSRLPHNLFIADTTILPGPLGNPPIVTVIALAKRFARIFMERKDY